MAVINRYELFKQCLIYDTRVWCELYTPHLLGEPFDVCPVKLDESMGSRSIYKVYGAFYNETGYFKYYLISFNGFSSA